MKALITDADYADADIERAILEAAGFEVALAQCRTPGDVIREAPGAAVLLVQYAPITAEVFAARPSVRLVSRYGVGVDSVDLAAARAARVWVANVPDYGVQEVALHATAMLLSLLRHLPGHDREVRAGRWLYRGAGPVRRATELTLGVAGLGRIGRLVAERAGPWFGRVLGHDPYLAAGAWPGGVERRERLDALFTESHALSLHLPLSAATRGLVDRGLLARMPPGSVLVNTARGGLVVLDDLLWALDDGPLGGAALDVLPQEPPPQDHPIVRHSKVLLSPHAAFYSVEAERELRQKTALNAVEWRRTGRPLYPVVEPQT